MGRDDNALDGHIMGSSKYSLVRSRLPPRGGLTGLTGYVLCCMRCET